MSHGDDTPLEMPLTLAPLRARLDRDVIRAVKRSKRLVNQEGVLIYLEKGRAHTKPSLRRCEKPRVAERSWPTRERRQLV